MISVVCISGGVGGGPNIERYLGRAKYRDGIVQLIIIRHYRSQVVAAQIICPGSDPSSA
jgi:hypothetical protein